MENTITKFLKSLVWKDGKPFCQHCMTMIEPCHRCGKKTAMKDVPIDTDCKVCEKEQNYDFPCRVCGDCFKEIKHYGTR